MRLSFALPTLLALAPLGGAQDLYDDALVRTLSLTFHQPDWWTQLHQNVDTGVYINEDLLPAHRRGSPAVVGRFANDLLSSGVSSEMTTRIDLGSLPGGATIQPGESWSWQLWFRDQNPAATSNTSDGVVLTFF